MPGTAQIQAGYQKQENEENEAVKCGRPGIPLHEDTILK